MRERPAMTGSLRGLRLATVTIALVYLGVPSAVSLVVHLPQRSPAAEVTGFAGMLAVLLVTGYLVAGVRPLDRWRWPLLAVATAALAVTAAGVPAEQLLSAGDWAPSMFSWLVLVLFLDFEFPVVAAALVAIMGARLLEFGLVGVAGWGARSAELTLLVVLVAYQLGIAFAATLLTRMAHSVAAATAEDERVRTAETVATHLHRDRRERYAGLDTVPVLTALAATTLDPADEAVRARCAVEASRLRRLFAERDEVEDPLLHEVWACADTAERRGVAVRLATCGTWPTPPRHVRRALTEPALRLVTAQWASVTVIGASGEVRVSVLTGGGPVAAGEGCGTDGVTVTSLVEGDRRWVEATWRTGT